MGAAARLNVTGTDFYPASVIYWGEQALSTTFVNSTSLTASLPGALTSSYGDYSVTVRTPAPGGGATAAQTVSVVDLRPTADSVSPIGGTGNATFTFKFSDPSGYSNLNF